MPDNSVKITLEAVDKTQAAFKQLESTSASVVSTLKSHWIAFTAAAVGAIYTVKKAFDFGKEIASNLNQIQRQAEMIGLTTTEYQKLSYAAKMSDVSNESLRVGMRGLSMTMGQFVDQSGEGYDTLAALGLSALDAAGKLKPLDQMFMEIAEKFATYADGATKIEYANKLFGRSGMDMISMLNKGKQGISAYGEELVKMGGIIGDVVVQRGSEAEDSFKRLEVRSNSLKISIGALALEFAEFGEKVANSLGGTMLLSRESDEMELKNLKAWLEYGKQKGASLKYIEDYERRILELESRLEKVESPSWIKEWVAGWEGKPQMPKLVTPPEPDWIKKWVKEFDGLQHSFDQLAVVSEQKLRETADAAIRYVAVIEVAFNKGKATANDLANAIGAATEAMKKVSGEDPTKKLFDLMVESQKQINAISKDDPDRQKKVQDIIDRWLEAMKIIQEAAKPTIDISALKAGFTEIKTAYGATKEEIESNPIKPKVDMSELNEMRRQNDLPMESTVDFYGTGSSKRPLSEKIQEIIDQFGGMDEALSGMGAMINFTEMTMQFEKLQKQLTQIQSIAPGLERLVVRGGGLLTPLDPSYAKQIRDAEESVMSQMGLMQMKMIMELFRAFGQGEGQTGISSVPKTGWYKLHKGEEVRNTNQLSDNRINNFYITSNDPKTAADEIGKILQYGRSGILSDAIKRLT